MAEIASNVQTFKVNTCSICLSAFKKPKLLPCFHTFCLQCLEEYVTRNEKEGKFGCPLCRVSADIPVGGVEAFQENFYIQAGELPEEVFCDVCENKEKATNYCTVCEEHFCENCSAYHLNMKMTRDHKLLRFNESNDPSSDQHRRFHRKSFCASHKGEEIKMICKDCNVLLCVVCKLTEHENHTSSGIAKEAKSRRKALSESIEHARNSVKVLEWKSKCCEKFERRNKNALETSLACLSDRIECLVTNIREKGEKLKEKLIVSSSAASDEVLNQKKQLDEKLLHMKALLSHAQNVADTDDDFSVLKTESLQNMLSMKEYESFGFVRPYTLVTFETVETKIPSHQIGKVDIEKGDDLVVAMVKSRVFGNDVGNSTEAYAIQMEKNDLYVSYLDYGVLHIFGVHSQVTRFIHPLKVTGCCSSIVLLGNNNIYFTCLANKALFHLSVSSKTLTHIHDFVDKYPRSSALMLNNELLVCVSECSDLLDTTPKYGCVVAVDLQDGAKKSYSWRSEECPGPTSIAVEKTSGTVCLGYLAGRKVSLHTSDGTKLFEFNGKGIPESLERFHPISVCFDPYGGLLIADYGNGNVIRTDMSFTFTQCLMKSKKPLCVTFGEDCSLFVGSFNNDIRSFKITSKQIHTSWKYT